MDMNSYFKCLIYKKILKVHKFVVHNLVNFVFFAYLCIRNQVKRISSTFCASSAVAFTQVSQLKL